MIYILFLNRNMLYNGCLYRLCMAICYKIESHVIFIQEGERQKMG